MSQFGAEYDAIMSQAEAGFPEVPTPTIADTKKGILDTARTEKLLDINPDKLAAEEEAQALALAEQEGEVTYEQIMGESFNGGASNLIDAGQASLYKTGQGFGELGRDLGVMVADDMGLAGASESLKGINFTSDEDVNEMFGYDPTDTQNKMDAVSKSYDEGDVLGTIGNAIKATPNVLADSFGDLVTLGLGGAGLFAKGAKGIQKGTKALKAEKALLKKEAYADIATTKAGTGYRMDTLKASLKERKKLSAQIAKGENRAETLKALDGIVRLNKGAIGLGATYTNDQLNARKENNNGEGADVITAMSSFAANTVLFGAQFNIIKKIGGSAARDLAKDLTLNTVKAVTKGDTKELAKAIMTNTLKVSEAAGAEAAQEYAQTWTQMLTEKGGTEKYGSVADVIKNKDNQKEANIGAILGAASGGTLRAAPMAVTAPVKATAKVGGKIIRKTADVAATKAIESSYKVLSAKERAELKTKFEAEDKAIEEKNTARTTQVEAIDKAESIADLEALGDEKVNTVIKETIAKSATATKLIEVVEDTKKAETLDTLSEGTKFAKRLVDKLTDAEKVDPATVEKIRNQVLDHFESRLDRQKEAILKPRLKTIKNSATAQYSLDKDVDNVANTFSQGKDLTGKVLRNMYEKTKGKAEEYIDAIPDEVTEKINTLVKEGKELTAETIDSVVEGVKDTDKGTTRALLDDLISGKPKRKTLDAIVTLDLPTLESIKKAVGKNKQANRVLNAAILKKKQVRKQFFGDEAINVETAKKSAKENIVDPIKTASKKAGTAIKEKIKEVIGKDATDMIAGLKGIVVDSIEDSETIEDLKSFVADVKKEGKIVGEDAKKALEDVEAAILAKAVELEQEAKKKETKKKEATPETNADFATIMPDKLLEKTKNMNEFVASLDANTLRELSKNPNITDSVKTAITTAYINSRKKANQELDKSNDTKSKKVDEFMKDEVIQQLMDEEGCN